MFIFPKKSEREKVKLEQLYEHYKNLMMYIAMDILKVKALAEEAVQEALIKILIHIDDIENISCHETRNWVVTITKRTALNKLQYENRRKHAVNEELGDISSINDTSVDEIAIRNITIDTLLTKLRNMDSIYSEIIMLRYYYGYTDSQLAAHLGISTEAVRKRCERGRKKLLKSLSE